MVTPQRSVRSSKALDLAHKLVRRENRTIADIVERALEAYEAREGGRELAAKFFSHLPSQSGTNIDFDSIIDETDALTKASNFDFSRHECDIGDFEQSFRFCRHSMAGSPRRRIGIADGCGCWNRFWYSNDQTGSAQIVWKRDL